ncbi:hypothetical protein GCM10010124_28590 [Pilimelia terevasa]|uniref:DUF676 domain-containing protein n=1 Tax=Pilimelia terevasa TaxID=53372 RepID=A0A8J3BRT4_9ACTN|nr:hypothetical protein [Pilimelia terevasa]GGK34256.1 hypothetical protein GCM10010124_28590 [Pilimelia terevasa]
MSTAQNEPEYQAGAITIADPLTTAPATPTEVPEPDEKWELSTGFAHVYYGQGSPGIQRPVIMADGFNYGPSNLDWLYQGLDGSVPFLSELRARGHAVILLGYAERSASILENARAAQECIMRTIASQVGDSPLTVGGFSMGGLVTRYALAKLELERMDHRTALYFSFDSPHRGAVIPIALQAFAHFIPGPENAFAAQMNSPAARQMLWRHYDSATGEIRQDPARTDFLQQLERIGSWPRRPRTIAVANGTGDGTGAKVPPGEVALKITGIVFPNTTLYTQAAGDNVTVAQLNRLIPPAAKTITTSGFPELDGAPGGTLDSFKILADELERRGGRVDLRHDTVCFVPSVSAVAIRDLDRQEDLYADINRLPQEESEVDEYLCASTNTAHTEITRELCDWIMERLPR